MHIDPGKICFGLSSRQDRISCALYLQLLGRKECAEALSERLSSEEIDRLVDLTGTLLRNHLSKKEYHSLFLQEDESDSDGPE